jgi:NAD(P)-dependent dehydrogenase (short-subunit alcohol dehydrogenase family)
MNLHGKVAVISGGARIGATVAETLATRGCRVVLLYRSSRESADDTLRRVRSAGSDGLVVRCDATAESQIRRAVDETVTAFGRLDILINMASIYEQTPFSRLTRADWERSLAANLTSAHLLVAAAARHLKAKGGGRVINFADWVAASGRPRYKDFVPYYTAKAGVVGLTEAQALELAPKVLVNSIAPGPILPPKNIRNEEVRSVARVTPLGRWGGAEEIAKAVVFLCETDFVTGECLRVDGGRHLF